MEVVQIRTYAGYSIIIITILIALMGLSFFHSFGAIILFFFGYLIQRDVREE
ncbi:MAG: hypothetical protein ACXAEU_21245 [Candidatus Hodarchaeales archaeon]|jgi:hypothetical protein